MDSFVDNINDAYYFVLDKIISLQTFFRDTAFDIGKYVLLIAILSAGLNYALTGQGLKENIVKILKATLFFFIFLTAYPVIISTVTKWTWDLGAKNFIGPITSHYSKFWSRFDDIDLENMNDDELIKFLKDNNLRLTNEENKIIDSFKTKEHDSSFLFFDYDSDELKKSKFSTAFRNYINNENFYYQKRFMVFQDTHSFNGIDYSTMPPSSILNVLFFLSSELWNGWSFDFFSPGASVFKAFIAAVSVLFVIFTGIFALLEYLVCFLEFMLVSSIGIILFPFSLWEGSKFMAESLIKAIFGFFLKLLFCTIAVFLLIYGWMSLLSIIGPTGFKGTVQELIFIFFIGLLFFYICKNAPAMAQSLMTGTPSLTGAGMIAAAAGAFAMVKMSASKITRGTPLQNASVGGLVTKGAKSGGNLTNKGIASINNLAAKGAKSLTSSLATGGAINNLAKDTYNGIKSLARPSFTKSFDTPNDSFKNLPNTHDLIMNGKS
jgi:hypothetical protein